MIRLRPPRAPRTRRNPLLRTPDAEVLLEWLNGKDPEDLEQAARIVASLKAPATDASLANAVQDFFRGGKKSAPRRELEPKKLFARLAPTIRASGLEGGEDTTLHPGLDVFSRVRLRPEDQAPWEAEDRATEALHHREDVLDAEDYRRYVSIAGEFTGEDALDIQKKRLKSKTQGRILSISGALCRKYRNVVRLSGYTPPREVLQKETCWILIGPAIGNRAPQRARVLSYRNGAHIDCDMVTTEATPLSVIIAKAIEGMSLWMIEVPNQKDGGHSVRASKIRSINIAQIGRPTYRVLWPSSGRDLSLTTEKMLQNAYKGEAYEVPWLGRDPDGVVDLDNYTSAVENVRSGAFDPHTPRRVPASEPTPTSRSAFEEDDEDPEQSRPVVGGKNLWGP